MLFDLKGKSQLYSYCHDERKYLSKSLSDPFPSSCDIYKLPLGKTPIPSIFCPIVTHDILYFRHTTDFVILIDNPENRAWVQECFASFLRPHLHDPLTRFFDCAITENGDEV